MRLGLPILAGALTPTEAIAAIRPGRQRGQAVPGVASAGRGTWRRCAIRCPTMPFVPVGGVDAELAGQYLAGGALAVGVGSPLVRDAAAGGDLAALRVRARSFLASPTAPAQPVQPMPTEEDRLLTVGRRVR